jgi:protease-4
MFRPFFICASLHVMTASDIDHIINHLSLKKSRRRWRLFAIGLAVLSLIVLLARIGAPAGEPHLARLTVSGLITGEQRQLDLLQEIAQSDRAKALIIRIDSPGGTTAGSEALFLAIRKVAEKKPVVAVMDTMAASGGYITALAADRIYARGNTITGSIGVIFTYPDVSQLLSTIGVKVEEVKSGELKAEPSGTHPVPEKARIVMQEMVTDGFNWFKGLVSDRRKLGAATVDRLSDGRVYSGRQALEEGLIDALGDEVDAQTWLESEKRIPAGLKIEDWRPPRPWLEQAMGVSIGESLIGALGLKPLRDATATSRLDGLLALWHPYFDSNLK